MNLSKTLLTAFSALVLVGATCNTRPPPIAIEPADTYNCASACEHLQDLGCEEGRTIEDGTTCTAFCEYTQKNGLGLNPTCVMGIKTCSEINACTESP